MVVARPQEGARNRSRNTFRYQPNSWQAGFRGDLILLPNAVARRSAKQDDEVKCGRARAINQIDLLTSEALNGPSLRLYLALPVLVACYLFRKLPR